MKSFIIHELTKEKESLEYHLQKNIHLTLVLILSRAVDADIFVSVRLIGQGSSANVIGLVKGQGRHRISIHTEQIHEAPETTSNLLFKAALFDESMFFYHGVIRIEKHAQKSNAYQRNENLLLSPTATARSEPALEILANDVRCTHGATIGKLSEDQLWYLSGRGLSPDRASRMLVEGFYESALGNISDTMQKESVRKILWTTT